MIEVGALSRCFAPGESGWRASYEMPATIIVLRYIYTYQEMKHHSDPRNQLFFHL